MKPPDWKITAFILTLLLAGFWYYQSANTAVTVLINDDGFSPRQISIKQGQRVVFKNAGNNAHWPASNFHPTHTLYPETGGCLGSLLDACQPLAKGESFSFIFNHTGTWPLHDHLLPGLTMVVVVGEESLGEAASSFDYAAELNIITELVASDPISAWEYLKKNFLINGEQASNAHEFTHIVGNALYDQYGLDGFKTCDPSFAFGCYHGVTEKALQANGRPTLLEIEERCGQIFPREFQKFASCIHGTGHGLVSWEEFNIQAALSDCDLLAQANQSYCWDGVFMEYITSAFLGKNPSWQFCSALAEKYQVNCGRYLVRFFENYREACRSAPSPLLRAVCSEAVGFMLAQDNLGDFDGIKTGCLALSDQTATAQNNCLISAAREVIFQAFRGWQETSQKLCRELSGDWQGQCLASNQEVIKSYHE